MTKIALKICGVMKYDDAIRLADLGVDYIGLNFIAQSNRKITAKMALEISAAVKVKGIKIVALFRDQCLVRIKEIVDSIQPDFVQLHGSEHHSYVESLAVPVIKSIPIGRNASSEEIIDYMRRYRAAIYLLDRETQGQGNGVDLKLAKLLINSNANRIILAGGINPNNIDEILSQVQPFGIDISSGVRTENEIDFTKVESIIASIRSGS